MRCRFILTCPFSPIFFDRQNTWTNIFSVLPVPMLAEQLDNWCHASCMTVCHAMSTNSETPLSENDRCWLGKGIELIFERGGFIFRVGRKCNCQHHFSCKRKWDWWWKLLFFFCKDHAWWKLLKGQCYTPNLPCMVARITGCYGVHMMKFWRLLICFMQKARRFLTTNLLMEKQHWFNAFRIQKMYKVKLS